MQDLTNDTLSDTINKMAKSVKQKEKEYKEKHNLEQPVFKQEKRPIDVAYEYLKDKHDCKIESNVLMIVSPGGRKEYDEVLEDLENKIGHVGFSIGWIQKIS